MGIDSVDMIVKWFNENDQKYEMAFVIFTRSSFAGQHFRYRFHQFRLVDTTPVLPNPESQHIVVDEDH